MSGRPEDVIREALDVLRGSPWSSHEELHDAARAALASLVARCEQAERQLETADKALIECHAARREAEARLRVAEQALRAAELQLWELDKVARSECDDPFAVVKTLAFAARMGITKALAPPPGRVDG